VILASSDMTHYEPQEIAESKDKKAIDKILKLEEKELLDIIDEYKITMCGSAPVAVLLSYVKQMGAITARLIKYETSAKTSGDFSSVVGYAGVIIL
jgi:AmmeMemoRadiSam system protein B